MREEEETTTGAGTLTGLEHHSAVELEAERLLDHILIDAIQLNDLLKLLLFEAGNL